MDALAFEHHLTSPQGQGTAPPDGCTVTAGGWSCCDEITFSVSVDGERVTDAGFEAHGCGAATAAASAAVTLVRGAHVLDAARIGPRQVAEELGGLSPAKLHAAELAADALARALGEPCARAAAWPPPARRPHPGGDERRRRQRRGRASVRRRRRDGGGHARAVVRPGERRRAQLLLGVRRGAGPFAGPLHGAGALHDRSPRRVPRRGGGAVHRRLRRRRDAESVRRL